MTHDELSDKVAAHEGTLPQMNARLGSLDTGLREIREELRTMNRSLATIGELRTWMSVLGALIIASGVVNWLKP